MINSTINLVIYIILFFSNSNSNNFFRQFQTQKADTYYIQSALNYLRDTSVLIGGGLCPRYGNLRLNKDLVPMNNVFFKPDNFIISQSHNTNFDFAKITIECQLELVDRISYQDGQLVFDSALSNKNRLLVFSMPMKYENETHLFLTVLYGFESSDMIFKFNKANELVEFQEHFPNK